MSLVFFCFIGEKYIFCNNFCEIGLKLNCVHDTMVLFFIFKTCGLEKLELHILAQPNNVTELNYTAMTVLSWEVVS